MMLFKMQTKTIFLLILSVFMPNFIEGMESPTPTEIAIEELRQEILELECKKHFFVNKIRDLETRRVEFLKSGELEKWKRFLVPGSGFIIRTDLPLPLINHNQSISGLKRELRGLETKLTELKTHLADEIACWQEKQLELQDAFEEACAQGYLDPFQFPN